MANNFVNPGSTIPWTNGGADVLSGSTVVVGSNGDAIVGIAQTDILSGQSGEVAVEGVWSVAKADSAAIAAGEFVMWDASASNFDDNAATPATGDVANGAWAVETKGATVGETIRVRLTGLPGTLS
jgi:predicted RecA/RadA family phage recombinase